jgi:hypothetical protein
MAKDMLISGILGGMVMFIVMAVCRLFLPAVGNVELLAMPDQMPIHAQLKERIANPGTYVVPYLPPEKRSALFPDYLNEPIFTVTYKGYTHATVPGFASVGLLSFLLAPTVAAWLLSLASHKVQATYLRRVLFVSALGLFIAISADLMRSLTDELSFSQVAGNAIASVVTWMLIGLILAWRIKPASGS